MVSKATVDEFLSCRRIAVIGVSRSGKKFGNSVFKELRSKGYEVYPVNQYAGEIEGTKCYTDLKALKGMVDGAVFVIPPDQTEKLIAEAASAGIGLIWLQRGSESSNAIKLCSDYGLKAVYGECILMFAEPAAFFHRMHKGFNRLTGRLPK